jgi:tetrapyrrole methylase family protein/MazG family protein
MDRNKSLEGPARSPRDGELSPPLGSVEKLLALVRRLRGPGGCPWDREVELGDLRSFLLEEAHETAAAIDGDDARELRDELGDLTFQICFLAVLAEERGAFTFDQVVEAVHGKMIERHPHVFAPTEGKALADAEAVRVAWEERKVRQATGRSLLDGVATSLPALVAARRLAEKAAGVGFDWSSPQEVLAKVREELVELEEAAASGRERVEEELGDTLFALASLGRQLGIDAEAALAAANSKFRRRFGHVERGLGAEILRSREDAAVRRRMEELWEQAKQAERETPKT